MDSHYQPHWKLDLGPVYFPNRHLNSSAVLQNTKVFLCFSHSSRIPYRRFENSSQQHEMFMEKRFRYLGLVFTLTPMDHRQRAIRRFHDQRKRASSAHLLIDLLYQTFERDHVGARRTLCNVSHRLFFLPTLFFGPNYISY